MKYKKITAKELDEFLRKHKLWLANDPQGERANLRVANLRGGLTCRGLTCRGLTWTTLCYRSGVVVCMPILTTDNCVK